MKPKSALRSFLCIASSTLLTVTYSQATTLYWDVNDTATGFSTVVGIWGTNVWNDTASGTGGITTAVTTNADDLNIVAATINTGTITVSAAQVANSIAYGSTVGAVTISGAGGITLGNGTANAGGITVNSGAGAQAISTAVILNNTQAWTNNAAGSLGVTGGINNNGNTLTIGGTGNTSFNGAGTLSGAGGVIKNGTGLLILNGAAPNPAHTFSGDITINGGGILIGSTGLTSSTLGNLTITGGVLEQYFGNAFSRAIGTGANQVQITGGVSGFSGQGATGSTFAITGTWKWGDATFNPTEFILQSAFTNADGKGTFTSGIDLNGTNRTIRSNQSASNIAGAGTFSGVISNSSGTPAGLIKTGIGHHILSNAANTYNGSTTITAGTLTANSTGALGNSSATNTLIFNGGTLRAGGAITSVAARGVTLTSTGIIDTNTFAVSIAGNITGAGGLTKNSTGTLTLSGTNSYGGVTTVNAGTLAIAKEASLYNGTPGSWTAANINVKSGATLALYVDSAGTAGFTASNLTTLLGNISVANTAAQGLQAGATLGIDTSTATGGTFTLGSAINNSTGAFGGTINLNKLGAGTLVLDQANTYTGNTIISAGTIQYTDGVAAPTTPIVNNAAFTANAAGTLTQGTNFGIISGTGTVTQSSAGTLTLNLANTYTGATTATAGTIILSNALAIQNSALNTTGAGFVTLSGITTPTFGGLSNSGTTRNLADVITTGYGSVTNLTLNPNAGSVTYDGVIADGAAGMSLTKTGAGTQVLTGIQTYTGATNLNVGTLTLSGTGSILPSAITFNGGGLTLTNTAAETGSGRVNDTTGITSNGGALTYNNTSGANVYAETIGSVALTKGQMNFVLAVDQVSTGSQTLTLAGLTRTGATNASALTFSAAGAGLNATKNMILVTGATATPAGGVVGPWATVGTAANVQTAFAAYDASGYVVAATPTVAALDTDLSSASGNYDINTGSLFTLSGTRTVNAVQFRGAASTLDLATFKLETNGFFFSGGASNGKTVTAGTGGALTTPTGGGYLYITAGQVMVAGNEHKISAPITDNGGAVHLVKSGSGTLILNGANYTYSGTTIVNAGTLQFGTGSPSISTQINGGAYAANIFIARGAALALQGTASNNLSGVISGDGNLNLNRGTTILSGANTYTGKTSMTMVATNAAGSTLSVSSFNSVNGGTPLLASSSLGAPTTVANGTIDFGGGGIQASAQINYTGSGETTDRVVNFQFNGSGVNRTIDASGSGLLKFTSAFTSNGSTGNSVVLQGSSNGELVGGLPFTFTNFTKSGAGTWTLGGTVGNTGTTTVSGGTLALGASNVLSNTSAISLGTATLNAATFTDTLGTLDPTTTGAKINLGSGATLAFADSSAVNWAGGTLNITGTFVSGSSLRFGTTSSGLTAGQLLQISGVGTVTLDTNGFLVSAGGNTYADWLALNAPATGFVTDTDNDGISNGVENVLGSNPNTFNTGLTEFSSTPTSVVFKHTLNPTIASDVTYSYQWSTDLVEWKASGQTNTGGTTATIAPSAPLAGVVTVTVTITGGPSAKLFGRLVAVQ